MAKKTEALQLFCVKALIIKQFWGENNIFQEICTEIFMLKKLKIKKNATFFAQASLINYYKGESEFAEN